MSSPLVIHEELKEYSDLIQNVGAIGLSPAPPPASALPPHESPPGPESAAPAQSERVRRVDASGSVAVARQTSVLMRKGPLIFNTAPESGEGRSVPSQSSQPQPQATSNPATIQRSMSQKPNFAPASAGLGAYPSPPTEFSPLNDEAITRQQPQRPLQVENHPALANKPEHQTMNFSVPRPQAQPQQQPYRPPVQNQPLPPTQIPRRQTGPAPPDLQPHPRKSQTLVRPRHIDPNGRPLSGDEGLPLSSDIQPKPHRVLTKVRQGSPATPPTSPKKSARRLDSVGELNDRGRPNSGISLSERPEVMKPPVVNGADMSNAPGRQLSQPDMKRQADLDPVVKKRRTKASVDLETDTNSSPPAPFKAPPTPVSPEDRSRDQSNRRASDELAQGESPLPPPPVADAISQLPESAEPREPSIIRAKPRPLTAFSMTAFSLAGFLSDAGLLYNVLGYLSFFDWVMLFSVSKQIRTQLQEERDLREEVLERYLETIGYERWGWDEDEYLSLTLRVRYFHQMLEFWPELIDVYRISTST